ncbi:MAG: DeoR/GlpR transcriptional regulator [Gammaproteobacteria bacterium]|jgi:DeoR family glycerol-3-phosphate regulon repressor|nr:DeoR/GlpR transcriptional regulator [Gammaproteobacteria bacterium]MCP4927553.1 DeoR/GlpR transcriptional regulator [Gammaproteobacteria bacterium]MDP6165561.1 DeoR/GlpR family DNA-binding transcription regulator [Gammaproteobacteria bacterium]
MALSTRQKKIMNRLHEVNSVLSSADITSLFNVTVQTIRKDLNELSELGLVRRVHGGISLPSSNQNLSFSNRTVMNLAAKQNIARKVVELLPENSSIFLGIGTTPQQVALALLDHPGLTVVTNNINVALTLCHNANIQTHLAGGKVRINDQDMMGPDTIEFLAKFNIQFGVFGVGGLNQKGQLLDFSPEESSVSRTIIENSATRILVVDHTKFERYAPVISGVLDDIDYLIMDVISEPIYEHCKHFDIEIFEVGSEARGESC